MKDLCQGESGKVFIVFYFYEVIIVFILLQ